MREYSVRGFFWRLEKRPGAVLPGNINLKFVEEIILHREGLLLSALPFHRNERLRGHDHHSSTVVHDGMRSFETDASFRRYLKRELFAEPACFPNAEHDTRGHPDRPHHHRTPPQVQPQGEAD